MEIKPLNEITIEIKQLFISNWGELLQLIGSYGYIALFISRVFFWMIFRVHNLKLKVFFIFLYAACGLTLWTVFEYLPYRRIVILDYRLFLKDLMVACLLASLLVSFFLLRWVEQVLDLVRWHLGASSSRARQSKTDIRTVHNLR